MKKELLNQAYSVAQQRYAEIGVDTEKVLKQMQDFGYPQGHEPHSR